MQRSSFMLDVSTLQSGFIVISLPSNVPVTRTLLARLDFCQPRDLSDALLGTILKVEFCWKKPEHSTSRICKLRQLTRGFSTAWRLPTPPLAKPIKLCCSFRMPSLTVGS